MKDFDKDYWMDKEKWHNWITPVDEVHEDFEKLWQNHAIVGALILALVASADGVKYDTDSFNVNNVWSGAT